MLHLAELLGPLMAQECHTLTSSSESHWGHTLCSHVEHVESGHMFLYASRSLVKDTQSL